MKWLEAKIILENDAAIGAADAVSEIFSNFGLQGTVLEEPGSETDQEWADDAVPLPESYAVIGYLPVNELTAEKCKGLESRLQELKEFVGIQYSIQYGELDEEDWAESWKAFFYPEKVTEYIVIKPTWHPYDPEPDDIVLEIDPGMAFGTGIHPTTSTCIAMIESYLETGNRMLDIGVGSGILMIAAAKLGAERVVGIDLDEVAVEIAEKNLLHNRIEPERFHVLIGNLVDKVDERFDITVANILSEEVLMLLEDIHRVMMSQGMLIVSGIIEKNRDEVIEKMITKQFRIIETRLKEGWATIAGKFFG